MLSLKPVRIKYTKKLGIAESVEYSACGEDGRDIFYCPYCYIIKETEQLELQ